MGLIMETTKVSPRDIKVVREKESKTAQSLCNTFLFFIRVSGLFAGKQTRFQSKFNKGYTVFEYVYSVISLLLLVSYAVLFTTNFWSSEQMDHAKLFRCIAFQIFTCAIMLFSIMMSLRLPELLPSFVNSLQTYEEHYNFCSKTVTLARRLTWMKFAFVLSATVATVLLGYVFKNVIRVAQIFYPTYGFSDIWRTSAVVFVFLTQLITTHQMSACLMMYVIVSYCAIFEFKMMSNQMKNRTNEDDPDSDLDMTLEFFYRKHEAICQIIESANECLKPFLLLVLAVFIPTSCLILYAGIVEETASLDKVLLTLIMILSSMTGIFIVLFVGGYVSSKANDMTGHLWKIKPSSLSERGLQTLTLFTTKLCGQSIGFSVYGLFTINMPAILTIFGTILAYFIVIFQFKPPDSVACLLCNCSTPA